MKEDIKTKWVQALTSGEYQQTRGKLADRTGFCCLGVLCDLAAKENVVSREGGVDKFWFNGAAYTLPGKVADWAGMRSTNGRVPDGLDLAELNDSGLLSGDFKQEPFTFQEISDVIEMVWEEL